MGSEGTAAIIVMLLLGATAVGVGAAAAIHHAHHAPITPPWALPAAPTTTSTTSQTPAPTQTTTTGNTTTTEPSPTTTSTTTTATATATTTVNKDKVWIAVMAVTKEWSGSEEIMGPLKVILDGKVIYQYYNPYIDGFWYHKWITIKPGQHTLTLTGSFKNGNKGTVDMCVCSHSHVGPNGLPGCGFPDCKRCGKVNVSGPFKITIKFSKP